MPRRNLNELVKGAGSDLAPDEGLRRGRGLAGMISGEAEAPVAHGDVATPSPDAQTSQQAGMSASTQVDMQASRHASNRIAKRSVKSFRLRDDLIVAVDVLAAQERRKIYEVIEEALELYLAERGRGRAG